MSNRVMLMSVVGQSDTPCDVCSDAHEFAVYALEPELSRGIDRTQFKPELSDYLGEFGIAFFCAEHLAEMQA